MKKIHKRRLLELAKFLRTEVPAKRFSMVAFGDVTNPEKSGCAACWAAIRFKRSGYELHGNDPMYGGATGFPAIAKFFGLEDDCTDDESWWPLAAALFGVDNAGKTPKQMAAKIERLIK